MTDFDDQPAAGDSTRVSKSQRKREAQELFLLGRKITELPATTLDALPLDADIRKAVDQARSMKSHGARKRQLGYLARLLRNSDTQPIREALESLRRSAAQVTARHHRAEQWRDRLITEGDTALSRLLEERHDADAQALRQLVRNARRELRAGRPPAAARKLFRMLRALDEVSPLPLARDGG